MSVQVRNQAASVAPVLLLCAFWTALPTAQAQPTAIQTPAQQQQGTADSPQASIPAPLVPIEALLVDSDGDTVPDRLGETVRVRGTVTIPPGVLVDQYFQAVVQDDTAGIVLFSYSLSMPIEIGELVEAEGVLDQYRGAVQLQKVSIQRRGQAPLPPALPIGIREADAWTYMGRRVRVEGTVGTLDLASNGKMRLIGDDDSVLSLFFPKSVVREFDWAAYPRGARVAATGVLSIYKQTWPFDGGFQLVVTRPQDLLVTAAPAPRWHVTAAWTVLAAIALGLAGLLGFHLLQRREKSRQRELATLAALSGAIGARSLDEKELARSACEILTAYGIVEAVTVHGFGDNGSLRLMATSGVDIELAAALDFAAHGASTTASSERSHSQWIAAAIAGRGLHMVTMQPLPSMSGAQGMLTAYSHRRRRPSALQERTLASAVKLIALALESIRMQQRARVEREELQQLAITDDLTKLYNRRFLDEYLRIQIEMGKRRGSGLAFVAIDIDHFKPVNDTWGHDAGDRVLVRVAEVIREATRSSDLPVRMGGEEFLIVLSDAELDSAQQFAERLRLHFEQMRFAGSAPGQTLRLTISIGLALYPMHGDSAAAVLRACDQALYRSKRGGRNRVTVADPVERPGKPRLLLRQAGTDVF